MVMVLSGIALSQWRTSWCSEASLRTLGYYGFAILQLQPEPTEVGFSGDVINLVLSSGSVSKVVLLILLFFSIASWGIALQKLFQFRKIDKDTAKFREAFRQSSKFSEVQAVCATVDKSPLVGIFQTGYAELNAQLHQPQHSSETSHEETETPSLLKSLNPLDRALIRAAAIEINKIEHKISFLATTASVTPFIGLFGTVWGIMGSFQGIAGTGSTSLGVVAPGIAEALVATAAGLFAAIPAVCFYNYFTNRVRIYVSLIDDFSLEFLNISERNFM